MKKFINILASLVAILSLGACNLDHQPTDALTYPSTTELFTTYEEAVKFSQGLPSFFRAAQQGIFWEASEVQGDMFNAANGYGNTSGFLHTMNDGFTAGDYNTEDFWEANYAVVVNAGYIIANIPNINTEGLDATQTAHLKQIEGEARFFRAYAYHQLATHFCEPYKAATASSDLGLPILKTVNVTETPARSTLEETYDFIKDDISIALSGLTSVAGTVRSTLPTVDAVKALSARVNLSTGEYTKAIADANSVITSTANYSLASTEQQILAEFVTQTGTESILMLDRTVANGGPNMTYYMRYSKMVEVTQDDGTKAQVPAYSALYLPNDRLRSLYENTDIRLNAYLGHGPLVAGTEFTGYYFAKYRGNPTLTTITQYDAGVTAARILALPEMYLIKAEAEAMSSTGDAKATLNQLQTARGASLTDGSMASVKTEWARETVGEGMRIVCLKRWGDGFTNRPALAPLANLTTGAGFNEIDIPAGYFRLTWPIPTTDIQTNLNLVQNPGW